ncbi:MAG: hypothetical protein NQ127_03195 [Candidatus Cardinium sp.]|nr:hypothetical protein [Candidatus Cardinium sp.]
MGNYWLSSLKEAKPIVACLWISDFFLLLLSSLLSGPHVAFVCLLFFSFLFFFLVLLRNTYFVAFGAFGSFSFFALLLFCSCFSIVFSLRSSSVSGSGFSTSFLFVSTSISFSISSFFSAAATFCFSSYAL